MNFVITAAVAGILALVLTEPLRRIALRYGIVDRPGPRKVHRRPVPYLGGLVVVVSASVAVWVVNPESATVLAPLVLIVAVGLYDDMRGASVAVKLIAEFSAAVGAVALGFVWHLTGLPLANALISIVWMVTLANSFNLLDNMDGLSSTAAAAALAGVGLIAPVPMTVAAAFFGATIGFLPANLPPARMFLGDAGSLSIGFAIALTTITLANASVGPHSPLVLVGPAALGLFDTSLVVVSRLRAGRPVQIGGRDHFSHRLLLLGWSRRQVLAITILVAGSSLVVTFLAQRYPPHEMIVGVPLAIGLIVSWLWLQRRNPYGAVPSPSAALNDRHWGRVRNVDRHYSIDSRHHTKGRDAASAPSKESGS